MRMADRDGKGRMSQRRGHCCLSVLCGKWLLLLRIGDWPLKNGYNGKRPSLFTVIHCLLCLSTHLISTVGGETNLPQITSVEATAVCKMPNGGCNVFALLLDRIKIRLNTHRPFLAKDYSLKSIQALGYNSP